MKIASAIVIIATAAFTLAGCSSPQPPLSEEEKLMQSMNRLLALPVGPPLSARDVRRLFEVTP